MRLINADELLLKIRFNPVWDDMPPTTDEIICLIKNQPTVNAVECDLVAADIRYFMNYKDPCKICKHRFQDHSAEICLPCSEIIPYENFEWRGIKDD